MLTVRHYLSPDTLPVSLALTEAGGGLTFFVRRQTAIRSCSSASRARLALHWLHPLTGGVLQSCNRQDEVSEDMQEE